MIYPYKCEKCETTKDVIKPMADASREELCEACGSALVRIYLPPKLIGTSVESAEYNPGLGCVTKSKYHRQEICKQRGLVEIGSDFSSADKMVDTADRERDAKKEKSWGEV